MLSAALIAVSQPESSYIKMHFIRILAKKLVIVRTGSSPPILTVIRSGCPKAVVSLIWECSTCSVSLPLYARYWNLETLCSSLKS